MSNLTQAWKGYYSSVSVTSVLYVNKGYNVRKQRVLSLRECTSGIVSDIGYQLNDIGYRV